MSERQFTFEISLSVLNHLGRQLYRSFATVLGEAISNAWDADAHNVWITVHSGSNELWIKDDGLGMDASEFQNKFLKIGYSKRRGGASKSGRGRPFIGRKGIGKLALLSCASRISVQSKVQNGDYVGGTIDNTKLDAAITDDLEPRKCPLDAVAREDFAAQVVGHAKGTIIRFEGVKESSRRTVEFLRKTIALYFRFSLLDKDFRIHVNGEEVTIEDLQPLVDATEFLWRIGSNSDPLLEAIQDSFDKSPGSHESRQTEAAGLRGFLASVRKPRDLSILTMDERAGVDLFVNGRLRERDILKHIPTSRVVENYLYGQIHIDALDDGQDRFTSSREGIVADDPRFKESLAILRSQLLKIVEDWDDWRRKHREDGDPDNTKISPAERASEELFNAVSDEFGPSSVSQHGKKVESWIAGLHEDATFNFQSYAECFVSENLIRKYITDRRITVDPDAIKKAKRWQDQESDNKQRGNISIQIRRSTAPLGYLSMDDLAGLVDKPPDWQNTSCLARDAKEFKPLRDAVAHTAILTEPAKERLRAVRLNIKERTKALLAQTASETKAGGKKPKVTRRKSSGSKRK